MVTVIKRVYNTSVTLFVANAFFSGTCTLAIRQVRSLASLTT